MRRRKEGIGVDPNDKSLENVRAKVAESKASREADSAIESTSLEHQVSELTLTPEGKVAGVKTYAQPTVMPYIAQKEPSPWIRILGNWGDTALKVGGFIGGGIVVGNALHDIVKDVGNSAGHNVSGSYNTDSHNSIPTTITNTTTTTTDSHNGDYRDVGGSLNDRHDVTTTDRHDTLDNHSYFYQTTP